MEYLQKLDPLAVFLLAALIAIWFFLMFRLSIGKPINKAEEQIFTLGIAFGGIAMFVGLQNVGVGNFRDNLGTVVNHLIGAVLINVIAMFAKITYTYQSTKKTVIAKTNEVASLDDLANVLRENQKSQDSNTKKLVEAMDSNQIKMDVNFLKLDNTLNNFVKDLGEKLIKQIQDVIETLNDKLTEQLGDNFKRLNDAVNNLVIWQNNYKEQLEKWQEANKLAVQGLEKSASALSLTAEKTSAFTESANKLDVLIRNLSQQYDLLVKAQVQIEKSLQTLADVPSLVTNKLNDMVHTLSSSASDLKGYGNDLSNTIQQNSNKVQDLSRVLSDDITSSQRKINDILSNSVTTFQTNTERLTKELFDKLRTASNETDNHIKNSVTQFESALKNQSSSLYKELEKSQQEYSQHLVGSAQKIEQHIYSLDQAVEKSLDDAIRQFAEKIVNIMTYAVDVASTAYNTSESVKKEYRDGRL